jgi:hypothetical protein
MINNTELELLLEGIKGGRLNVLSSKKKELGQNRTKYTFIIIDTAIPESKPKIEAKKSKVATKKEVPKEKVVIYKENQEKKLPMVPKPLMAQISNVGSY